MSIDVVSVQPLDGYRLRIEFEDGVKGEVDVSKLVEFTGIFAALKDRSFFQQVLVNPDIGTVCWPNSADIDPDVLYHAITGEALPDPATHTG